MPAKTMPAYEIIESHKDRNAEVVEVILAVQRNDVGLHVPIEEQPESLKPSQWDRFCRLALASDCRGRMSRLERLYPLPKYEIVEALSQSGVDEFLWLQEEPSNYGAGTWLGPHLSEIAEMSGLRLRTGVARRESSSPAGSFLTDHGADQAALFDKVLASEEELQEKDAMNG
jgi:hypothetical protein